MYEAIITKVILYQVEIGEDFCYKVNWLDDLDFETFWVESYLQDARINFWMQEKNWRMMNHYNHYILDDFSTNGRTFVKHHLFNQVW